jgi:hypothetical protein
MPVSQGDISQRRETYETPKSERFADEETNLVA